MRGWPVGRGGGWELAFPVRGSLSPPVRSPGGAPPPSRTHCLALRCAAVRRSSPRPVVLDRPRCWCRCRLAGPRALAPVAPEKPRRLGGGGRPPWEPLRPPPASERLAAAAGSQLAGLALGLVSREFVFPGAVQGCFNSTERGAEFGKYKETRNGRENVFPAPGGALPTRREPRRRGCGRDRTSAGVPGSQGAAARGAPCRWESARGPVPALRTPGAEGRGPGAGIGVPRPVVGTCRGSCRLPGAPDQPVPWSSPRLTFQGAASGK